MQNDSAGQRHPRFPYWGGADLEAFHTSPHASHLQYLSTSELLPVVVSDDERHTGQCAGFAAAEDESGSREESFTSPPGFLREWFPRMNEAGSPNGHSAHEAR